MTCYFCNRLLGGFYQTVFLQWEVPQIEGVSPTHPAAVMKEKAHIACLERAQGIFAKAQSAGGGA